MSDYRSITFSWFLAPYKEREDLFIGEREKKAVLGRRSGSDLYL
jgi:hypothetical protein